MERVDFKRIDASWSVYRRERKDGSIDLAGLFVDDFLLISISTSPTACADIVDELKRFYEIRFFGPIQTFFGINIKQDDFSIGLSMPLYIATCLDRFDLINLSKKSFPMQTDLDRHGEEQDSLDANDSTTYRSMVGALLFIANTCRPDVAFASNFLARSMANPTVSSFGAAKRVWRYLAGSKDRGLLYRCRKTCEGESLSHATAYFDSDWAADLERRRSTTTGYVFYFAGAPVIWRSSKQAITTLSSTEAGYLALADAGKESIYFKDVVKDLGIINIADNKGAIDLAHNPQFGAQPQVPLEHQAH
mmetsp:Transcript_45870/g.107157  ORF Transcript_45870/g.107157 Transcript_45870/m.107157 type:complete len:305 (-) Transcript_45870:32-946(-)